MATTDERVAALAERHGLSRGAVQALAEALRASRGGGAQWNHPDLGGMGQWSGGGMLQIGAMFDDQLKARVRATLEALAETGDLDAAHDPGRDDAEARTAGAWWPAELGAPSSTGAQNAMRYACFPDRRRLVVEREGRTTIYDTGTRRLTGFAQAQGPAQTLSFSGPDGPVTLDALTALA